MMTKVLNSGRYCRLGVEALLKAGSYDGRRTRRRPGKMDGRGDREKGEEPRAQDRPREIQGTDLTRIPRTMRRLPVFVPGSLFLFFTRRYVL